LLCMQPGRACAKSDPHGYSYDAFHRREPSLELAADFKLHHIDGQRRTEHFLGVEVTCRDPGVRRDAVVGGQDEALGIGSTQMEVLVSEAVEHSVGLQVLVAERHV